MTQTLALPNRAETLRKVQEVLNASTDDPIAELRAMGRALVAIADALQGLSPPEARAVISAVVALRGTPNADDA